MGPLGCATTLVTTNLCSVMSREIKDLIGVVNIFVLIVTYLCCFIKWKQT